MKPIDQYNEQGYVKLRNFFNDAEVQLIDKQVDRIYSQWLKHNEAEIYNHKLVNMHSLTSPDYFENMSSERVKFFEAIASVKLTHLLESMFGPDIYFHNSQLFFNPSNSTRLPYWHRDMQYSPIEDSVQASEQGNMTCLHVRIPLVQEKGLELIKGSHNRWDTELERSVRLELNGHKNSEALPGSELIELSVGDILIFDAQMIHRGNYELNPTRKAFDLCVGKPHRLTSPSLDAGNLPAEKEMEDINNNRWYRAAHEVINNRSSGNAAS